MKTCGGEVDDGGALKMLNFFLNNGSSYTFYRPMVKLFPDL